MIAESETYTSWQYNVLFPKPDTMCEHLNLMDTGSGVLGGHLTQAKYRVYFKPFIQVIQARAAAPLHQLVATDVLSRLAPREASL